jgi:hypothetical protein
VPLELIVDYSEPGDESGPWTDVVVWTLGNDPRVIESQHFKDPAELRVWLKAVAVAHRHENITVRWPNKRNANKPLSRLIAACLAISPP